MAHGDLCAKNIYVGESIKLTNYCTKPSISSDRLHLANEVLAGSTPNERSDIYSLGYFLYQVFEETSPYETIYDAQNKVIRPMQNEEFKSFEPIIKECLDKDEYLRPSLMNPDFKKLIEL